MKKHSIFYYAALLGLCSALTCMAAWGQNINPWLADGLNKLPQFQMSSSPSRGLHNWPREDSHGNVLNLRSNNITIAYFIEMTGTNGCKNTQTLTYNVIPTPDIPSSATLKYDTICSETGISPFIPKTPSPPQAMVQISTFTNSF